MNRKRSFLSQLAPCFMQCCQRVYRGSLSTSSGSPRLQKRRYRRRYRSYTIADQICVRHPFSMTHALKSVCC